FAAYRAKGLAKMAGLDALLSLRSAILVADDGKDARIDARLVFANRAAAERAHEAIKNGLAEMAKKEDQGKGELRDVRRMQAALYTSLEPLLRTLSVKVEGAELHLQAQPETGSIAMVLLTAGKVQFEIAMDEVKRKLQEPVEIKGLPMQKKI